ncbi:MAG TPA: nucleotidyltransferase domain-containing protein [Rhabdochlamydiaceae bacterium]|nr:nucleotidyltransferase domain-containing protein [Rhabdochlamydiaceae bacterium]
MKSLFKLFANPSLVETLGIFLTNPDQEFYQMDIVKKTGHLLIQVQRALKVLVEIGLITSEKRGKMVYYKAIRTFPGFEDLKNLFFKAVGLGENIRTALDPVINKIDFVFIFGSVAKNEESITSDIDLFIIGKISLRELTKFLSPLGRDLQREMNPVVFDPLEFQKRVLNKDHFLEEVIDSKKIWIIGSENEFKKLVKRRKT